jgi:hypothetical protein
MRSHFCCLRPRSAGRVRGTMVFSLSNGHCHGPVPLHELARNHELIYQPSYAACVQDTLAAAWAQANVIRTTKDKRTALRATP